MKGQSPGASGSLERLGEACLGYFYSTSRCYQESRNTAVITLQEGGY